MRLVNYPPVIAITGYIGAGKSTMAQYLCDEHGYALNKFADPLKSMLRAVGLTREHTDGALKHEPCDLLLGQTPRHAMQTLGTDWGRGMIGDGLWVNLWRMRTQRLVRTVADDLRFANEVLAVRELGGILVKIDRPGHGSDGHASEASINGLMPEYFFNNTGTVADMRAWVDRMVDGLIERHIK